MRDKFGYVRFIPYFCFMEVTKVIRKGRATLVRKTKVSELDKVRCSRKFLELNLPDDAIVNVKCDKDGIHDLRGKRCEYRIVIPDNFEEAVKHVQNTYCDVHLHTPYMLLGDVAELIRITTGNSVNIQELTNNETN
jgi:hypothetical protein